MQDRVDHRRHQRGNSFGSCLALVILLFGGVGFYYFNFFQWRNLENPHTDLVYLKTADAAQKNTFRKSAISDVMGPPRVAIQNMTQILKKTKKGTEVYPEFDQETTEVLNKLRDGINSAKLRTIPRDYEKSYKQVLTSYAEAYHSVNELKLAVKQKEDATREKHYKASVGHLKKANQNLNAARNFYISEGI